MGADVRHGIAAIAATIAVAALFSAPLAMVPAGPASAGTLRHGAIDVVVTLPAGERGGCREAARMVPDLVIGSPVNIRGRDAVPITSLTWDGSGTWCLGQARAELRGHHRYVIAPWSLPWRSVRTNTYGITTIRLRLR